MFPIKIDSPSARFPFVTITIMLLCVAAFFARPYFAQYGNGFVPVDFMYSLLHPGRHTLESALSLLAAFFLHAGWLHIISNLWYLWLFGAALESVAGRLPFILIYLGCGVLSMVIQAVSTPYSNIPVMGASGAIAGVMGAFLVLLPLARIVMWIPLVFFVRIPALAFLLLWFGLQYLSMRLAAPHDGAGVAWWAHIGGFTCGFLIALRMRFGGAKPARRASRALGRRARRPAAPRRAAA